MAVPAAGQPEPPFDVPSLSVSQFDELKLIQRIFVDHAHPFENHTAAERSHESVGCKAATQESPGVTIKLVGERASAARTPLIPKKPKPIRAVKIITENKSARFFFMI